MASSRGADVVLTVEVMPRPEVMTWPQIRTATHVATVGCARPAEDAFRIGVQELVRWMHASCGMDEPEAVLLLGQVLEARCTQFVNPRYTYVCKIDRRFLPGIYPPLSAKSQSASRSISSPWQVVEAIAAGATWIWGPSKPPSACNRYTWAYRPAGSRSQYSPTPCSS